MVKYRDYHPCVAAMRPFCQITLTTCYYLWILLALCSFNNNQTSIFCNLFIPDRVVYDPSWYVIKYHYILVCRQQNLLNRSVTFIVKKKLWQQLKTSGQSNLTKGRITVAHGRFSRIRQVATMCTPCSTLQWASAPNRCCSLVSHFLSISTVGHVLGRPLFALRIAPLRVGISTTI